MAQAEALVPAKRGPLPRLGRLGWLFWSILIAAAMLGAAYVAVIFGYREQVMVGTEAVMVPDRWAGL